MTSAPDSRNPSEPSAIKRLVKVIVSIVVLTPLSVFLGYGGWLVLTVTAAISGYDPRTEDGELLRKQLLAWPDRNREVMRTNGRAELPLPSKISEWATTQRNLTIFTAIIVAVPIAYAFHLTVGSNGQAGDFLLLVTLAVGIPTAYDEYWPQYDRTWKAIAWVLVAVTVITVEFTGFYLLGSHVFELSAFHAAVGAFLVTDLGNLVWLVVWQNH